MWWENSVEGKHRQLRALYWKTTKGIKNQYGEKFNKSKIIFYVGKRAAFVEREKGKVFNVKGCKLINGDSVFHLK